MAEAGSGLVLVAVVLLLLAGVLRQFAPLGPRGLVLDSFAVLPQWKFFAQRQVANTHGTFDDLHLLVRCGTGNWQELLWWDEPPLHAALWNPDDLSRSVLAEFAIALAASGTAAMTTSRGYLAVLRFSLEHGATADNAPVQFAIATTQGRAVRAPVLAFLSAWHIR